ncbi:MAG TPA: hypothetical protein VG265_12740, partial [Gaiellaceae bacterium]|nr:hypothetical protein [Gaiellaceae bacterium]
MRGSILVGLLVVVAMTIGGLADAAPSTKQYETSFTPSLAAAGAAGVTYMLTLQNDPKSNQTLGSANFLVPSRFSSVSVTQPVASGGQTGWSAAIDAGVLELRSATSKDGLAPGQALTMSVTLTAPPISTACFDYSWHSAVKQSNDFGGTGNDFALQGADAALTVAKLVITGQPAAVVQAGSTFSTSVSAEDGCGTVLKTASGNVALGLGANPSGG